jgi:hypothetical protein
MSIHAPSIVSDNGQQALHDRLQIRYLPLELPAAMY